jgi:hypothetical protein
MTKQFFLTIVFFWLGGCAAAAEPVTADVVLIRAHIVSLANAPPADPPAHSSAASGSETLASLSVTEILIGQESRKNIVLKLNMSAWPATDRLKDIYVLSRLDGKGQREVIGWTYRAQGMCIDDATAGALDIRSKLDALYASGRLTCPRR